jgi:hypothetical protein
VQYRYREQQIKEDGRMKYIVWHAKESMFLKQPQTFVQDEYDRVAVVECPSVDDVFRATNHIDSDWTQNPEVVCKIGNRHRSTSVGDVVEEFSRENKKFLCSPIGWQEVV